MPDKSSACCLSSTSAAHQSSSNAAAGRPCAGCAGTGPCLGGCIPSPLHIEQLLSARPLQHPAATPEPLPTHTARFLDGRAAAADWHAELARESAHILKVAGRRPGLGVVLVGDRPDSKLYVTRKREACEKVIGWATVCGGAGDLGARLEVQQVSALSLPGLDTLQRHWLVSHPRGLERHLPCAF